METMFDGFELFIGLKKGFNKEEAMDKIEKAIDRDDLHGVFLPLDSGVSIFFDEIPKTLDVEVYKTFVETKMKEVFSDQLITIEYEF